MTFAKNDLWQGLCITLCWHQGGWSEIHLPSYGFQGLAVYKRQWVAQTSGGVEACQLAYFRLFRPRHC